MKPNTIVAIFIAAVFAVLVLLNMTKEGMANKGSEIFGSEEDLIRGIPERDIYFEDDTEGVQRFQRAVKIDPLPYPDKDQFIRE